jgi:SAM-dependent methyltransferase
MPPLRKSLRESKSENDAEKPFIRALGQLGGGTDAPAAVTEQTPHALSESDPTINKLRVFRTLIPSLKAGKMLDLGSGKGNFSLAAARCGWKVSSVDARTVRWPKLEAKKRPKHAELVQSIEWVQADVREFPISSGEYDLICILGLLHRLEIDDQVKLLRRCSETLTLLDVRTTPEIAAKEGAYEGAYFHQGGQTREERDQIPQSAWGNEFGFRHTEESLLRLVRDCGYSTMMQMRPPHRHNYTFYLCLPPP